MADKQELMQMRPIGYMRSVFQFKNGTPRQPSLCSAARGCLTVDKNVFNNPEHAVEGLDQYSHAWIMFVFHKNQPGHSKAKVKPPRLNGKKVGVFSTRSPYRPNAIGLTLAKIERISGATVHFSGIDIIDGTPVLDIKPFIPQYDVPKCRGKSFTEDSYSPSATDNDCTAESLSPLNSGSSQCSLVCGEADQIDSNTVDAESVPSDCPLFSVHQRSHGAVRVTSFEDMESLFKSSEDVVTSLRSPEHVVTLCTVPDKTKTNASPGDENRFSLTGETRALDSVGSTSVISHDPCLSPCVKAEGHSESVVRGMSDGEKSAVRSSARSVILHKDEEEVLPGVQQCHTVENYQGQHEVRDVSAGIVKGIWSTTEQGQTSAVSTVFSTKALNSATTKESAFNTKAPNSAITSLSVPHTKTANSAITSMSVPHTKTANSAASSTSVAQWLSAPPVSKLHVSFTPTAETQLQKFTSVNASNANPSYRLDFLSGLEDVRAAIVSVLAEDPRSVYRREKCSDSLYFFTVDKVHVTCWFDDKSSRAEVVRLQPVLFVDMLQPQAKEI